ncbi:MAG: peptidase T [Firmicutes bacterium HGW-Firmicutes-16]|nr:MAG: peptidase T [Firmicutes bacterium HGW-Firmicutes-16]
MTLKERFLNYVSYDTQSSQDSETMPSTDKQWTLARLLEKELLDLGAVNVRLSEYGYVMAELPSNMGEAKVPALGFIAHMDTSPDAPAENIKPRIIENYDGGTIVLNDKKNMVLDPKEFESLKKHIGETLIVTDGTTLLGADDKAGVAEIMTLVEYLATHPEAPHGKICIGFTPDEEIGKGADKFDVSGFGADFAYTVDGGDLGEIEFENFNGANAGVFVQGKSIHPGSAKNKMINASLVATEFASLMPQHEIPSHTEDYEGFYHLHFISGTVEEAELQYLIRDHDREKFEDRKCFIRSVGDFINNKYGENTVQVVIHDQYFNMREQILPHMELIDIAKKAMEAEGITPEIVPIRGGTDGARLSYMGLPCPNLCTGGQNFHGPYEYCSLDSMEKISMVLVRLTEMFAKEMSE